MKKYEGKIPKTIIALLGVVLIALLALAGYQFWAIRDVQRQIDAQLEANSEVVLKHEALQQLSTAQEEISQRISVQETSAWTWSDQMPVMAEQVTGIVKSKGMKISLMQPEPVIVKQQLMRFPLRLTLDADLRSTMHMVNAFYNTKPALSIDRLKVRAGSTPGDVLRVEMTLSSYVMLTNTSGNTGDKP